jgi:hypothetical protein
MTDQKPEHEGIYTFMDCPEKNSNTRNEKGQFVKKTNWEIIKRFDGNMNLIDETRWCRIGKVSVLRPCSFNRENGNCPFGCPL